MFKEITLGITLNGYLLSWEHNYVYNIFSLLILKKNLKLHVNKLESNIYKKRAMFSFDILRIYLNSTVEKTTL